MIVPMPFWEEACAAGAECANGPDTSQVGLDYGNFPFKTPNLLVNGSYFFAVVEPGYERTGFLDGGNGNLSDTTPSNAPGDRGSGDTEADRTITSDGQLPVWAPKTHGTHPDQYAMSGFQVIEVAPFDETPNGQYELAVCPTGATSHCQCEFGPFDARPHESDGGSVGAGGTSGAGGAGGTSNTGGTTSAEGGSGGAPSMDAGAGGTTHGTGGTTHGTGGTTHGTGGTTHGTGGTTHGAGGSGGVPCVAGAKSK